MLNVIHSLKRADVLAIQNDLALELVPILLDMVMLHHDDHHIDL